MTKEWLKDTLIEFKNKENHHRRVIQMSLLNRDVTLRHCGMCGDKFKVTIHNRIYCSEICARQSKAEMHKRRMRDKYRKNAKVLERYINILQCAGYKVTKDE